MGALPLDMSDLPDYSGEEPVCAKCGKVGANTNWVPTNMEILDNGNLQSRDESQGEISSFPGWLLRYCQRCNYQWAERTIDDPRPV